MKSDVLRSKGLALFGEKVCCRRRRRPSTYADTIHAEIPHGTPDLEGSNRVRIHALAHLHKRAFLERYLSRLYLQYIDALALKHYVLLVCCLLV